MNPQKMRHTSPNFVRERPKIREDQQKRTFGQTRDCRAANYQRVKEAGAQGRRGERMEKKAAKEYCAAHIP